LWRRVHGAARVLVLEPGAADVGVLLQHLERNAELLQADRGAEATEARADDDDLEALQRQLRRRSVPANGPGVLLAEAHVFGERYDTIGPSFPHCRRRWHHTVTWLPPVREPGEAGGMTSGPATQIRPRFPLRDQQPFGPAVRLPCEGFLPGAGQMK
jgi:hypothetical protein